MDWSQAPYQSADNLYKNYFPTLSLRESRGVIGSSILSKAWENISEGDYFN